MTAELIIETTGEVITAMTEAEARDITRRINSDLDGIASHYESVMPLIREALTRQAWAALGYNGPSDYIASEFDGSMRGLTREVRQAVVAELSAAGMSTRAIAPVVGAGQSTVSDDLRAGDRNRSPEPEHTDEPADEEDPLAGWSTSATEALTKTTVTQTTKTVAEPIAPVIGIDGKRYPQRSKPAEPRRKPLTPEIQRAAERLHEAAAPEGQFATFVADPPWRYGNTSTRGAAENHYGTMSIEELCELPIVRDTAADQSHLYLWATAGHLPEAFRVMECWGFEYKTYLVWVKPQMGMGNYFRVSTEIVLFGVRGGMRTQHRGLKNWFELPRRKHSAKPAEFQDLVMKASPGPYMELFSRCYADNMLGGCQCSKCRHGWTTWGNQS